MSERKAIRERQRARRDERAVRLKRLVPLIRDLCKMNQIELKQLEGGVFQFRKAEYIVSWSPRTNRIAVQYKGTEWNHTFQGESADGKAKILIALECLMNVTKREDDEPQESEPAGN